VLLSVIGFKQYTIWTGESVLLRTVPVDPRDLLRGDFVTVRYEISTLELREIAGDDDVYGRVYVELGEGADGYWTAVAVHNDRERSFDDTVLIKGDVRNWNVSPSGRPTTIEVDYGIEEIFIPEGSGSQLPIGADHVVAVQAKVDRWGNAIAREFFVDGEPFPLKRR
jgi:uncharacterized membrane-anchored protein